MRPTPALGIRWTIGDVHPLGFDALRLSLWGARRAFPEAALAVCVNSLDVDRARERTGEVPPGVEWISAKLPAFLGPFVDPETGPGAAWKLAPVRVFPDRHELALDNDVILWSVPRSVRKWLHFGGDRCLVGEDVASDHGRFSDLAGGLLANSGIRGLPPGFDYAEALKACLREAGGPLETDADERGLQVAAASRHADPVLVPLDEVALCGPFAPMRPGPGTAGAHFSRLNADRLPFSHEGKPATTLTQAHYLRWRGELQRRVGLVRPPGDARLG